MPTYEYTCDGCRKTFDVVMSLAEHARQKPKCPGCGSRRVRQNVASGFFVQTSKKS
jgi:putative FmdB family regulatory protein